MSNPDLKIRGGGGASSRPLDGGASKKFFRHFVPQFDLKIRGAPRSLLWICHCSVIVYQVCCLLRVLWSLLLNNIYIGNQWSAIDYYFIIVNIIVITIITIQFWCFFVLFYICSIMMSIFSLFKIVALKWCQLVKQTFSSQSLFKPCGKYG